MPLKPCTWSQKSTSCSRRVVQRLETRSIGSRHRSRPTLRLVGGSKQTSQRRYTPLQNAPIGDNISALIGRTHAQVTAFAGSADLRHGNSAAGGMGANRADLIPDSTSKSLRVQLPFVLLPSIKSYFHQTKRSAPLCSAAAASWFGQMTFPHTAVSCVSRGKAAKPPLRRFSACSGVPAGSSCPTSATASCS